MEKIYVVTGGSSGIGLSCIEKLAKNAENHVISFSRSTDKIKRAIDEIKPKPANIKFIAGDVTQKDDCEMLSEYIGKDYGRIHGLVHAAGVLTKGGIEMVDYDQWKFNLDVNLNGPYLLTQSLLNLLKAANGAAIVNVSSVASMRPGSSVAYSVSKAGLDMLTEFLAGDLAPYKIRVNSVNPGFVRTNIHLDNNIVEDEDAYNKMAEKVAARYPLERIGEPGEVADLILYLLSKKAEWITGSIFKLDGGTLIKNDLIPAKK